MCQIPIIIFSVILLFGILGMQESYADVSDTVYKDHAYSIKSYYYNLESELKNGIISAEIALSSASFENSDAKKKIDTAWSIRQMAWVSNGQIESNLRQTEDALSHRYYKYAYDKLLQIENSAYSVKGDLYAIIKEIKNAQVLEKNYQESKKSCILFFCYGDKDTYTTHPNTLQYIKNDAMFRNAR